MEGGFDFPGFFAQLSQRDILTLAAEAAFASYAEERIPHHEKHGNPEDFRLSPVVMSVSEMEALLEFFRPFAEEGEVPDMLCPLLSEIAGTLANNMTFKPMGPSGDPNNN